VIFETTERFFDPEVRSSALRPARGSERCNRRPVGWASSDVKQPDRARRIDEDIAPELTRITLEVGSSGRSSPDELFRVGPPRGQTPDVPRLAAEHPVPSIERPRLVHENRPPDARLVRVRAGPWAPLERHYDDAGVQFLKRSFVLLQLQQMPAARQSTEMPMEDQQQPVPAVVFEAVEATFRIRQREWHSGTTNERPLHD